MPKGRNTKLKLYCLEQWIKANNIVKTPKRLAEVFYAGMGFMMCRSGTIEKVTYPWFEPIMHEIEISKDFSSEDVSLCWKWRDAGVKIWVDPDVLVGHEKSGIIRGRK